jgi:hypothetical protein
MSELEFGEDRRITITSVAETTADYPDWRGYARSS